MSTRDDADAAAMGFRSSQEVNDWQRAAVEAAKPAPEAPSYELSSKETGALNRALLRSVKFEPAPEAVEPLRAALETIVALCGAPDPDDPCKWMVKAGNGRKFSYAIEVARAALSKPAPEAVEPLRASEKRWPFVETPGQFTQRLHLAIREYGDLLAAVRYVLIEQPPTLAALSHSAPETAPA